MNTTTDLVPALPVRPRDGDQPMELIRPAPSAISILEAAVRGGITSENVAVVERIVALARDEKKEASKAAFVKAFFQLRQALGPVFADKEVKTKSGDVAFTYCSPKEIQDTLDPLLQRFGFATMTGQSQADGKVTVTITLMHEAGHSEDRAFTVRVSPGNSLMTPTQCDAGATTAAERHAFIKMFGMRTRIRADDDPRLDGDCISAADAKDIRIRVGLLKIDEAAFLKFAQAKSFEEIATGRMADLNDFLTRKEREKTLSPPQPSRAVGGTAVASTAAAGTAAGGQPPAATTGTPEQRVKMFAALDAEGFTVDQMCQFGNERGWGPLDPLTLAKEWPLAHVPASKKQMDWIISEFAKEFRVA